MPLLDRPIKWITWREPFRAGPVDKHPSWKGSWSDIVQRLSWEASLHWRLSEWLTILYMWMRFLLSWLQLTVIRFNIMTYIYINGDIRFDPFMSERKLWWFSLEVLLGHFEALGCFGFLYNHLIHSSWNLLCGRYYGGTRNIGMNNSVPALKELRISAKNKTNSLPHK